MFLSLCLAALVVGIADPCSTDVATIGVGEYAEAVRAAGDIPVVICRTARPDDLRKSLKGVDLLILPGGEDVDPARYGEKPAPALGRVNAVRDDFEFRLLAEAVRREIPVFAVCRGLQMMNVFFGGTLHQDLPSDLGAAYTVEHRDLGKWEEVKCAYRHPIAIEPGSRLSRVLGLRETTVNSAHHQAIKALAPGFRVAATAPDGVIEAIECDWYPAAAVQFHPETLAALKGDPTWVKFFKSLSAFVGKAPKGAVRQRPIGVFDSGIGGLSVLEQLLKLDRFDNATGRPGADGKPDFADEQFVYFGDQANMPYGRYDAEGKSAFLRELVIRDAQFVLGSQGHAPSKAVVIACNTATAYGLMAVREMEKPRNAKVFGVVNAGVESALDALKDETEPYAIAVMATPGTISSGVYERTIREELARRGVKVPVEVANRGGVGLAEAVENSEPGMRECARTNVVALVEAYRARGGKAPIRVFILGCTHYPFVLDVIKSTVDELRRRPDCAGLLAPADRLEFIDPAVNLAAACYRSLRDDGLLRAPGSRRAAKQVEAFLSVGKSGPLADAVKYGRDLGPRDLGTKIEPMRLDNMPKGSPELIRAMMPESAKALGF